LLLVLLIRCGVRSGRIDRIPNSCDPWPPGSKPGSCYGPTLDIVAPGTNVPTTRRTISGTYDMAYGGTSAAAPHIAGVAALILSVNSNLSHRQVKGIIERTAQKVRSGTGAGQYNYQNNLYHPSPNNLVGRPNGGWHQEMGYGLVNAHAAVLEAQNYCTLPLTSFTNRTVIAPTAIDGNNVNISNVVVNTGKKLTVDACNSVTIEANFEVQAGAEFEIWINP